MKKLTQPFFLYGCEPPHSFDSTIKNLLKITDNKEEILTLRTELFEARKKADAAEKMAFDKADEKALAKKQKLQPYDHVVIKRLPRKKYKSQFLRNIYQVVSQDKRKVCLRAIFSVQPKVFRVHASQVKPLDLSDEIFDTLTPSLRLHMGGKLNLPRKEDGSLPSPPPPAQLPPPVPHTSPPPPRVACGRVAPAHRHRIPERQSTPPRHVCDPCIPAQIARLRQQGDRCSGLVFQMQVGNLGVFQRRLQMPNLNHRLI